MGHISLISPVTNIILFKTISTNLSRLLGIPVKNLEEIVYLRSYIVIDNGSSELLKKKQVLEKKIDHHLIDKILQEIIENKEVKKDVVKQAQKLKEELEEKEEKDKLELDTVFLEDYLDFLEKH